MAVKNENGKQYGKPKFEMLNLTFIKMDITKLYGMSPSYA